MLSERFCSWMRQNGTKFSPRLKGWVQKIFLTLLSNFGKGLYESFLQFCPFFILYKKTTCQFQIKFITEDHLQVYKILQLFTNSFTFNTNKFASIKEIKNTYVQTQSYWKSQAHQSLCWNNIRSKIIDEFN